MTLNLVLSIYVHVDIDFFKVYVYWIVKVHHSIVLQVYKLDNKDDRNNEIELDVRIELFIYF